MYCNYKGKVFGLAALLHSNRCVNMSEDNMIKAVSQLLTIAKKKPYMGEVCFTVLVDALVKIQEKFFKEKLLSLFEPLFATTLATWSPETLALALAMQRCYKTIDYKTLFQNALQENVELVDE
eukprot:Pgem_evm1s1637